MNNILIIIFIIILSAFLYLLILNIIFLIKNLIIKLGKKIYKFGHIYNRIINWVIWWSIFFIINRIAYFYNNFQYFQKDFFQNIYLKIVIISILIIVLYFFYIKFKRIEIYESGIKSSIVSYKWLKIKCYRWIFDKKNNEIIGLELEVNKNIFLNWTGIIRFKIKKKESPYVKLIIEKYMYDYKINNKGQNDA